MVDADARPVFPTVSARIAARLRESILSGEISPGTRLMQNHVAREFDVSTTPVREAFTELLRDGLVRGVPHRGVEVIRPTLEDARETAELQAMIECACIAASAPNLTDADLERSRVLLHDHRAILPDERRRGLDLDTAFHFSLLVGCPNKRLRALAEKTRNDALVHRLVLIAVDEPTGDFLRAIWSQHEAIYEACAQRDGEKAARLTAEHIMWGVQMFAEPPS